LEGFWGNRAVKIPFANLANAEKVLYSTYIVNNPVYNLHRAGIVKFYTGGKDAVRLIDKSGQKYLIGTNKPEEFLRVVLERIKTG
jgi:hypothetical protein